MPEMLHDGVRLSTEQKCTLSRNTHIYVSFEGLIFPCVNPARNRFAELLAKQSSLVNNFHEPETPENALVVLFRRN